VEPHLASGALHLVSGAPSFFYPIYTVYSAEAEEELIAIAREGLRSVAATDPVISVAS
jgi:hypothetical protein